MYGDTTCGIGFSDPNVLTTYLLIGRAAEQMIQDDGEYEEVTELGYDQMGLGYVVY